MKKLKDYVLPYKGLSLGTHQFTFEIDKSFFKRFDYFESESGKLSVDLELIKEASLMDLQFKIKGNVNLQCDRCLGFFDKAIDGQFRLVVKFGDSFSEEAAEVIVMPVSESSIDLKQYLFEYVNLLLPIKRAHENEKDCDPAMIQKLQNHYEQKNDPRWDILKDIKLK